MTSKYNLVWIFIDGVRRYYADDDRGRLAFMDKFAEESIEFRNVVTSAPSTFMSISAMMSGMPSYYIYRTFSDLSYDDRRIPSLRSILLSNGFVNYNFWMSNEARETMMELLPIIDHKYWPSSYKHRSWWNNQKILEMLDHFLKNNEINDPAFFFVGYNCRKDILTSDIVEETYNKFRHYNFNDDNTVFILCSDHGYPDPSKETGRPEYYKKNNLTHDVVLTDDNIMIPLFIKYPNCPEGLKIDTTIASIDIMPTILNILKLDNKVSTKGKSLLPLINNEKIGNVFRSRYFRCDSRLSLQTNKGTAIRNDQYKYICYHGSEIDYVKEEFFDIVNDELETENLIDDANYIDQISIFRKEFKKSENNAFKFHFKSLYDKFSNRHSESIKKADKILLIDSCNPTFSNMLINMIKKINEKTSIKIVLIKNNAGDFDLDSKHIIGSYDNWKHVKKRLIFNGKFDIVFVPYNTSENRDNYNLLKNVKKIKTNKIFYIDYNMSSFKKTYRYYWKIFIVRWSFMKHEPGYMFWGFLKYMKEFIRKIKKIL